MGKAKRRSRDLAAAIAAFADQVLRDTGPTPLLALGPIVWGIEPGADTRYWYFIVASTNAADQLRLDQLKVGYDNQSLAEKSRATLLAELISRRPPSVITDVDDELALAEWCEAVCPGERSRNLRASIQRERAEAS